jgi:hypothetical protein
VKDSNNLDDLKTKSKALAKARIEMESAAQGQQQKEGVSKARHGAGPDGEKKNNNTVGHRTQQKDGQ